MTTPRDANDRIIAPGDKVRFVGVVERATSGEQIGVLVRASRQRGKGFERSIWMPPGVLEVVDE